AESQSHLRRLVGCRAQVLQERIGEIRLRVDPVAIERNRVDRLHFDAADASRLHHLELASKLLVGHRGAAPPPAHHDPAVVGRREECTPQRVQSRRWLRRTKVLPHRCRTPRTQRTPRTLRTETDRESSESNEQLSSDVHKLRPCAPNDTSSPLSSCCSALLESPRRKRDTTPGSATRRSHARASQPSACPYQAPSSSRTPAVSCSTPPR